MIQYGYIKTCRKCGETKAVKEFAASKRTDDDFHINCRACDRLYRKARKEIKKFRELSYRKTVIESSLFIEAA